ncbi:MAG TPA: hypothetical protein VHZ09_18090 [Acidobacteriaceae bacterium]|jgi:hypothetical protein|nr:hypothetical protein [Acidobacteriaceae bacterium]
MTTTSSQSAPRPVSAAGDAPSPATDDFLTVVSIAALAFVITDALQQALGHAVPALLTISPFGLLTAAGWSSAYDNTFIDAGGAIVNFAAAGLFWILLAAAKPRSPRTRLLLVLGCAFNLLAGTGYLVFAALTDFGDWYSLLRGFTAWSPLRILLFTLGAVLWIAALFVIASLIARSFGILRSHRRRLRRLTFLAWLAAVVLACASSAMNLIGVRFVLLSDFPATVFAQIGLLFVPLCLRNRQSDSSPQPIARSWTWFAVSAVLTAFFIAVLGRGIALHGKLQ